MMHKYESSGFHIVGLSLMTQGADKWLMAARSEVFYSGQKIAADVVRHDSSTILTR